MPFRTSVPPGGILPSFLLGLLASRVCAGVMGLVVVALLTVDVANAREGARARRTAAPRMTAEARTARHPDRAPPRTVPRPMQESPVEAAPAPVVPPLPPAERPRPGRLTTDERRALRQQINDAGHEIYRPDRP